MQGNSRKPIVIALTGGIASGKTAASDRFAELGVPVIDTDVIAREVVEPGQPAFQDIVEHFGEAMLSPAGTLDRAKLRARIFANPEDRRTLEALTHPAIIAETKQQLAAVDAPYVVVVIPLLTEIGKQAWIDRVLVIDALEASQLTRLQGRDGVTEEQARAALRAQASRNERLRIADDVIFNDSDLEALRTAIDRQHADYLALFSS